MAKTSGRPSRRPPRLGDTQKLGNPHEIDRHVGSQLRLRRMYLGLSQEKVAKALGITFQQIQKYERGSNRISASRLYQLACFLDVPVGFFYDGLEPGSPSQIQAHGSAPTSDHGEGLGEDLMKWPTTGQLVSRFYRISDKAVRNEVLALLRILGKPKG